MEENCILTKSGNLIWYQNGLIHREDGPAMEYASGSKQWIRYGYCHRDEVDTKGETLPAVERANGDREWCLYGYLHRENGPAIERANGRREWYIHGKRQCGYARVSSVVS